MKALISVHTERLFSGEDEAIRCMTGDNQNILSSSPFLKRALDC